MGYECYTRELKGPMTLKAPADYKNAVRVWCNSFGKLFTTYGLTELEIMPTTKVDAQGQLVWNICIEYSRNKSWRMDSRINFLLEEVTNGVYKTRWYFNRDLLSVGSPAQEDAKAKVRANPLLARYLGLSPAITKIRKEVSAFLTQELGALSEDELMFLATSSLRRVTSITVSSLEQYSFLKDVAILHTGPDCYEYTADDMLRASQEYQGDNTWYAKLLVDLKHWG